MGVVDGCGLSATAEEEEAAAIRDTMSQTGAESRVPALPSAALTAKVIPLEGEAEDNQVKAYSAEESSAPPPLDDVPMKEVVATQDETPTTENPETQSGDETTDEKPDYHSVACLCLSTTNPLRVLAMRIYEHPNFDRTTMTLILGNCVTLALFDPLDTECEKRCKVTSVFDQIFALYFAFEMVVKMLALGVFSCGAQRGEAYMDSSWNRFDCFIVITSLVDFLPGMEGPFSAFRIFRALRPLRAINKFPQLRVLVKLLMDTIPMLSAVGMLCFFIFFVFGILAVQFFMGVMHQRCFNPSILRNSSGYGESYFQTDDGDGEDPYICATGSGDESTGLAACIDSQGVPSAFTSCRKDGPIPLHGAIHYDNILAAWIVLFQIITLEGWVDQMYFIQGAYSFHLGWIYFCTLVVIGAFFAVNLALVVISSQFGNSKDGEMAAIEAADAKAKEERERRYREAKERGEKLSLWEQFQSGDLFRKSDEDIEADRQTRLANLRLILEGLPEGEAKAEVERDIERLENLEEFPITQAEANAQGGIQPTRYFVRRKTVIEEDFGNFIMAVIALNVTLMATEHHNQPEGLTLFLEYANYVFCAIFAMEMVLKQFALGWSYFEDKFNCFDFVIVIISFVELGMGGGGLSVLRMLRLVRVFKLVKFLPELQRQFAIMGETLGSVLSFLVLLGLFIFIFAVLGMFIFGGHMTYEEEDEYGKYDATSRKNFDTLLWALVTIFQTLTLEDWNAGMYDGVRGTKTQFASLYYIVLIMFGNYIMFNLFVAILIDGFGSDESGEEEDSNAGEVVDTLRGNPLEGAQKGRRVSKLEAQEMLADVAGFHAAPAKSSSEGSGVGSGRGSQLSTRSRSRQRGVSGRGVSSSSWTGTGSGTGDGGDPAGVVEAEAAELPSEVVPPELSQISDVATKYVADEEGPTQHGASSDDLANDAQQGDGAAALENVKAAPAQRDYALCLFSKENALRRCCSSITSQPMFDQFIMFCIIANSICMGFERPSIKDGSTERVALDALGHVFSFIFSVEMIMKLIAHGLFYGENSYWNGSNGAWNRLDGTIVVISWLDLALTLAGVTGGMLSILKICRMLRALRPLRAINRLPGLKRIVNVLIMSLSPIGTTLIIVGCFFFLFGVLGGQLYAGQFYYCDESDRMLLAQIKTKEDCHRLAADGEDAWKNQPYNFDNLPNSLMTLFVLSSIDGWVEIMYLGVDIAGVDMQPQENNQEGQVLFFVLFLLIGGFFIINMFVGVIVENFQKNGAPEPTSADEGEPEPEPDYDDFEDREKYPAWRVAVLEHATSSCFESFIAAIIILNVVVMGSEHYDPSIASYENDYDGMSAGFKLFLRISNYIFTIIFVYELVVKYIAFGCYRFHMGSHPRSLPAWNNFDCFIVFISLVGILFDDVIGADNLPINPSILRILRILRVARILKLLKSAKDLVVLLVTVSRSLAQVGNLGLLLFLLFFIYAALGIELFGTMACTDNNGCDGLSDYANFENFGMAMLVLFRLSTGDNWNGMMKDGLRGVPPEPSGNSSAALITQYGNDYGCSFAVSCSSPDACCAGCDPDEECKENCCASAAMTPLYYISFCVLSTFVMLNLVVATLMGELERAGIESEEEEKAAGAESDTKVDNDANKAKDLSVVTGDKQPGVTVDQTHEIATEPGTDAGATAAMPSLPSEPSPTDEGPSSGSRVKLDPLPMRPVSPSVFVPFAPETVDNEPVETGAVPDSAASKPGS